jgi:APA family basic amino acid/polyamine antiporter
MKTQKLTRSIGLMTAISIVVGNMIGSGFFKSPQQIASVANPQITILTWLVSIIGIMLITYSYANLGSKYTETGGPILYASKALGKPMGFVSAWLWWVTSWIGNAAIVTLAANQIQILIPAIEGPNASLVLKLALILIFTYFNVIGVKEAGKISLLTTIIKISIFIGVAILGIFALNLDNYNTVSESAAEVIKENNNPTFSMFTAAFIYIMWAFTGIESATLTGGEIKNPEKNIKRSTLLGVLTVSSIYLIVSVILMGVLSQDELANSKSVYTDAIIKIFNQSGNVGFTNAVGVMINGAILVSVVGALSGWFLTTARSSYSAAENGFFPKVFGKVSAKYKTPINSIIISNALTAGLIIITFIAALIINDAEAVGKEFDYITAVAAFFNIPTYLITIISEYVILKKAKSLGLSTKIRIITAAIVALIFIYFGYLGAGVPPIYWQFSIISILLGIPIYMYSRKYNSNNK